MKRLAVYKNSQNLWEDFFNRYDYLEEDILSSYKNLIFNLTEDEVNIVYLLNNYWGDLRTSIDKCLDGDYYCYDNVEDACRAYVKKTWSEEIEYFLEWCGSQCFDFEAMFQIFYDRGNNEIQKFDGFYYIFI